MLSDMWILNRWPEVFNTEKPEGNCHRPVDSINPVSNTLPEHGPREGRRAGHWKHESLDGSQW
jgi:hypothetical protein